MKFRIAVNEIARVYYEIEAVDQVAAECIVSKLNGDQLDIDDIGEVIAINDSYCDGPFELTGWVDVEEDS